MTLEKSFIINGTSFSVASNSFARNGPVVQFEINNLPQCIVDIIGKENVEDAVGYTVAISELSEFEHYLAHGDREITNYLECTKGEPQELPSGQILYPALQSRSIRWWWAAATAQKLQETGAQRRLENGLREFEQAVKKFHDSINQDRRSVKPQTKVQTTRNGLAKKYHKTFVEIGRRDGFNCAYCGSASEDLQIDHI